MRVLDIGEVSRRSGVLPSTLRYYEELGLIRPLGRHGLRRQFDADILLKLALIGLGKSAGFTLAEIAGMFGDDGRPEIPRERLRDRAEAIGRQIRELCMLRDMLRHVAECPAPSHLECPNFRKLLSGAMSGPARGTARANTKARDRIDRR